MSRLQDSPTTRSARIAVIAVTGAALFMIVLDNLIVVSTLPAIQRGLHASLSSLEWVIDAYILSFGVAMLTGAALGERFGRRRVFVGGVVVFSLASAAGALAPSVGALVAARVVQGLGGAVLFPLTLTLVTTAFPPERRAAAIGLWSAVAGLGVALGPIAGGLLTAAGSWHWIFWVNVPVGAVVVAAAPRILQESRGQAEPLDLPGMALAALGLFAVIEATVRATDVGWGAPQTLGAYAVGVALLAAFVAWERRTPHAMVPARLFREPAFASANALGFLLHFAMFGAFLLLIQYLAGPRGQGPISAGAEALPWTLMPLLVSPLAGRAGQRRDSAGLAATGLAILSAGLAGLAVAMDAGASPIVLAPELFAIGTGIGIVLPNLVTMAVSAVAPADVGKASGMLSTSRQVGAVFGVAVIVAVDQAAGSLPAAAAVAALAAVLGAVVAAAPRLYALLPAWAASPAQAAVEQ